MSASQITVCNLALALIGDNTTVTSIDPPDQSVQANYCSMFYSVARAEALEYYNWTFAVYTLQLAQITHTDSEWEYAYSLPSDFIRKVKLLDADGGEIKAYTIENSVLYSNELASWFKYISSNTPESKFSPLFVRTLSTLLASYLAGPILKGDVGVAARNKMSEELTKVLAIAEVSDSRNHSPEPPTDKPFGIAARA